MSKLHAVKRTGKSHGVIPATSNLCNFMLMQSRNWNGNINVGKISNPKLPISIPSTHIDNTTSYG